MSEEREDLLERFRTENKRLQAQVEELTKLYHEALKDAIDGWIIP